MTDDRQRPKDAGETMREGLRSITGILGALKDAIEQTFDDLREGGDLSPERAADAARSTFRRAQETMGDMRERLDFVSRREFDALRTEVDALRARVDGLAGDAPAAPADRTTTGATGAAPTGGKPEPDPAGDAPGASQGEPARRSDEPRFRFDVE